MWEPEIHVTRSGWERGCGESSVSGKIDSLWWKSIRVTSFSFAAVIKAGHAIRRIHKPA